MHLSFTSKTLNQLLTSSIFCLKMQSVRKFNGEVFMIQQNGFDLHSEILTEVNSTFSD